MALRERRCVSRSHLSQHRSCPSQSEFSFCPLLLESTLLGRNSVIRARPDHDICMVLMGGSAPLSGQRYSELSTQLTDDSLAPVLVLAEVTKKQLAEVGKHLVRLWLASGQILGLTHVLVSRDVASEQSTGTLFRGNTLATKVSSGTCAMCLVRSV